MESSNPFFDHPSCIRRKRTRRGIGNSNRSGSQHSALSIIVPREVITPIRKPKNREASADSKLYPMKGKAFERADDGTDILHQSAFASR